MNTPITASSSTVNAPRGAQLIASTGYHPSNGIASASPEAVFANLPGAGTNQHDFERRHTDVRPQPETQIASQLPARTLRDGRGFSRAMITVGELIIDPMRYEIQLDGNLFRLTPTQFRLLTTLAECPGRVYTRDELLAACRGDSANSDFRTIDVHIRNLRIKLGSSAAAIETVRGFGYSLRDPGRSDSEHQRAELHATAAYPQ
jgi:DNA-binding winged helix-turn-helix (wHTH) protein